MTKPNMRREQNISSGSFVLSSWFEEGELVCWSKGWSPDVVQVMQESY